MKLVHPKTIVAAAATAALALSAPAAAAGTLLCSGPLIDGATAYTNSNQAVFSGGFTNALSANGSGATGPSPNIGFITGATTGTTCPPGYTDAGYASTSAELSSMLSNITGAGGSDPNAVIYNGGGTPASPGTVTVANGVGGSDAANIAQLNAGMAATQANANAYTDGRTGAAINTANAYTDAKSTGAISTSKSYTDTQVAGAITTANNYTQAQTKYFQANSSGAASIVTGANSVAVGPGTVVAGSLAIGGGVNAVASGDETVVFGANAHGTATGAVAIGSSSRATAAGATAMGQGAIASGANSTAVGVNAVAVNAGDVAMGSGATATGIVGMGSAVAIGAGNRATGAGAVAIGDPSIATGTGAIAAGFNSIATADGTAIGGAADGAIAAGNASIATGQGSVALGNTASTGAAGGIAIGDTARALQGSGIALGTNATASNANDVALGAGSSTAAAVASSQVTINAITYGFAGTAPVSTVSVGAAGAERTVTNVAAGRLTTSSTDAVNGSQLNATNQAVNALGTNVHRLGSTVADNFGAGSAYDPLTGAVTAPAYTVNKVTYSDVGSAIQAIGSSIAANNTRDLMPASATGANSVAVGPGSVANRANTVSFGAPGAERQLANVADATSASDATNLGQVQRMVGGGVEQSKAYTDQRIQALDAKVQTQLAGVGALAMAASALVPNARAEGNTSVSIAAGEYGGQGAIAAGVNHYVTNQILLNAKVGVTNAGTARVGMAIGATFAF
ncbi:YadA family autotransporter adhesin [Variovorax saccharolyticus]|uniref:YadA family autotransporter adhesin n=1 Tax=Variovorax saccharolyticus TaxID=3053516 RepID=UPI002578AA8F|nr:YadA-like family protein [Variovorax sp. J31P216]MDM0029119.1 YadA-like family protein [Variovorax sp. J31P216]